MARDWFYERGGEENGPVQMADLQRMASGGKLSPTDLVWTEGMPDWSEARRVKGLFRDDEPPKKPEARGEDKRRGSSSPRGGSRPVRDDADAARRPARARGRDDEDEDEARDEDDDDRDAVERKRGGSRGRVAAPSEKRPRRGGGREAGRDRDEGRRRPGSGERGGRGGRGGRYDDDRAPRGTPGMVIAGFITVWFCAPIGLVLSLIGRGEAKRRREGEGLALAGIILGILGTLSTIGWGIMVVVKANEFRKEEIRMKREAERTLKERRAAEAKAAAQRMIADAEAAAARSSAGGAREEEISPEAEKAWEEQYDRRAMRDLEAYREGEDGGGAEAPSEPDGASEPDGESDE